MIIPEVIIYNTLQSFQQIVITDYNAAANKDDSLLAQLFKVDDNRNPIKMSNYNYYKQAVAILTRDVESPRLLTFNLGYNMQRQGMPTIHILMPNENKGRFDSLGHSEKIDQIVGSGDFAMISKSRTSSSVYYLMITSDNSSEVMVIYYWLKAMLLMFHENLELLGLRNLSHAGQDINLQQELAPPNMFHRNLSLSFEYESGINVKIDNKVIKDIKIGVCSNFKEDFDEYMENNKQQA